MRRVLTTRGGQRHLLVARFAHSGMTDSSAAAAAGGATDTQTAWATLREGQAEVLHKPGEAFYNKAQVQNRDLSIAVIREFIKLRERDAKAKAESGKGGASAAAAAARQRRSTP